MSKPFFRAAVAASVVLLTLAVSCQRRPLYDLDERVRLVVEIDTDGISNITKDIYNPKIAVPSLSTDMLRVLVYGPTTKALLTQSFISEKSHAANGHEVISGTVEVGQGDFDFVAYNFDTPTTKIKSEDNENNALAYTEEVPASLKEKYLTKATDFNSLPVNYEPEHLFVARIMDYHISARDTLSVIYAKANTIIDTYYIQIRVDGLKNAASAFGVISGLSPSNTFVPNVRTSSPATGVYFDLIKSTDDNIAEENKDVLCAIFSTFGKLENVSSDVLFTVNVVDANGDIQQKEVNLDAIFKTENAVKRHWLLIDEVWKIEPPDPGPGVSGGGFQPEVGDWDPEEGGISL